MYSSAPSCLKCSKIHVSSHTAVGYWKCTERCGFAVAKQPCQLPRNMLKPFIFVSLSIHFWFLCFSSIRPFFEFTQVHSLCRIFGCVKTAFSAFLARQMRCAKWRCEGRRLSWLKFDVGHHRPWMHFAKREFTYITRLIRLGCFPLHYLSDSW